MMAILSLATSSKILIPISPDNGVTLITTTHSQSAGAAVKLQYKNNTPCDFYVALPDFIPWAIHNVI